MSSVVTKSLLLSQPKTALAEGSPIQILPHTTAVTDVATETKVEIPGVDPSTVDVQFENNTLSVRCERGELNVPVNPAVDTTKIKADIQWGVLTLTIPLPAPPESRSIKVSIHDAVKSAPSKSHKEFTSES